MTIAKGQQVLQTQLLPLNKIQKNTGQVPGLPRNPRIIRDSKYARLKKSIEDFPYMLSLREIVVFPYKSKYVCIGGNMRYDVCRELSHIEIPAKVLPKDFPIERLREFALKDNVNFGEDDLELLNSEWSTFPLEEWGLDVPDITSIDLEEFFEEKESKIVTASYAITLEYGSESDKTVVSNKLADIHDDPGTAVKMILKI